MARSPSLFLPSIFPIPYVVGWDRPAVLNDALGHGAIQEAIPDLATALEGAELVYVALPVGHSIELLPDIARLSAPDALVTDACGTRRSICTVAAESFHGRAHCFCGGPPDGRKGDFRDSCC